MSGVHLHLWLNHVPILGTYFGLALLVLGLAWRADLLVRAAWLGLVVSALAAGPVYFSGEPAEDTVKGRAEVSEWFIERHEDAAKKAFAATLVLGLVAVAALVATRGERRPTRVWVALTLVFGLVAAGLLGYAGGLGGKIRHAEIRPGAASAHPEAGTDSNDDDH